MPEPYLDGPLTHVEAPKMERLLTEARACPPGAFVEFGVYRGGSAYHLAKIARDQGRKLYLFDTFTGMPYQDKATDRIEAGEFHDTSIDTVRALIPDAIICAGVFPATMVDTGPIAFAHIDCDQARGVRDAVKHFAPLMVRGGRMMFDDVILCNGARIAFDETIGRERAGELHDGLVRF